MDKIQFIKNKQNLSKKNQFFIIVGAFVIFTVVVILDIFNVVYLRSVNNIPIQKYFMIFTVLFVLVLGLTFICWKKPKSWILYIVLPILISAISWNINLWLLNMPQITLSATQTVFYYAFFPYLPLTWILSALMVMLHFMFVTVYFSCRHS